MLAVRNFKFLQSTRKVLFIMTDTQTSKYFDSPSVTRSQLLRTGSSQKCNKESNDVLKRKVKKEKVKIKYETDFSYEYGGEFKKEKWEPPTWRDQLKNIHEMRKNRDAPVDSMGCDVISDVTAKPEVYRYQVLLSLMLSSQTKDQITSAAMSRLREHGCTIDNILKTDDKKLGELIYPVGFWKRKVEYIKKTSKILLDQYNGDIPKTVEDLCKLTGVGPKMAYLVMKCAWNEIQGIGVDTHVHRISNRLGWHKRPTKQPEDTRKSLEDWLPRELWSEINHLLVGFGQQTCLPVYPKCSVCLNKQICPYGRSYKSPKKSPKKLPNTEIKKEEPV